MFRHCWIANNVVALALRRLVGTVVALPLQRLVGIAVALALHHLKGTSIYKLNGQDLTSEIRSFVPNQYSRNRRMKTDGIEVLRNV